MKNLNQQFYIRNKTKRGYIFLYVIVFLLLILSPKIFQFLFPPSEITLLIEKTEETEDIQSFEVKDSIEINKVKKDELINLGIDSTIARRWIDFREAKNGFTKVEDVKAIYGIKDKVFKQLQPWLFIKSEKNKNSINEYNSGEETREKRSKEAKIQWSAFNPNTISKNELTKMGLSSKTASIWMKYKNAIGKFDSIEQIKKIYGIDSDWYSKAKNYISFPKETKKDTPSDSLNINDDKQKMEFDLPDKVNINNASATTWDSFPDIDKEIGERIEKYRHSIDGFKELNDLADVYGVSDSFVSEYDDILYLGKETKINSVFNINTATVDDLKKHPEISQNKARLIVSYRKQHGTFSSIDELRRIRAVSAKWIAQIKNDIVLQEEASIANE